MHFAGYRRSMELWNHGSQYNHPCKNISIFHCQCCECNNKQLGCLFILINEELFPPIVCENMSVEQFCNSSNFVFLTSSCPFLTFLLIHLKWQKMFGVYLYSRDTIRNLKQRNFLKKKRILGILLSSENRLSLI